jgi:hypothetical protein
MFKMAGATVGTTVTSYVETRLLYFLFAGFLLTSLCGLSGHLDHHQETVRQDGFSRWLELEGCYYDESSKKKVRYRMGNAHLGSLGI